MKVLYHILFCLLFTCAFLSNANAEEKVSREQVDTLWDEVKRFDNPHAYYVDLSQKLWDIKYNLLRDNTEE